MSGLVFPGASQFAAMQIWAEPVPVATLILTTLAINARHLVMGAVLAPWLRPIGRLRAFGSLFLMVDESWGLSVAKMKDGATDAAYLAGSGAALYVVWAAGTIAGRVSGGLVPDPAAFALDFLPLALFLALLMTFWRGPGSLVP
jgi:predicted branched-subunit amino acid permease